MVTSAKMTHAAIEYESLVNDGLLLRKCQILVTSSLCDVKVRMKKGFQGIVA